MVVVRSRLLNSEIYKYVFFIMNDFNVDPKANTAKSAESFV